MTDQETLGAIEEFVTDTMAEIVADRRYHYKPANVHINTPLAMEQLVMVTKVQMLQKLAELLDIDPPTGCA